MKRLLTTTALVLAMTVGANAAQLLAGPIYSANAYSGLCWYTNLGTTNVTPTSQVMYFWNSTTAISTYNSCSTGSPVAPGQSCYFEPNTPPYDGLSCKVVFSTSVANVRGSLEMTDASHNVLSQVELR
jgi:hypothetical protein